jgi:hypothetical protein
VLPEPLRRTSLVKIEDEPAGEVCPVSRHSTLRRYFILVGSHRTADPESKATAKTTTKSVNQAHFAPGSHFGEEQATILISQGSCRAKVWAAPPRSSPGPIVMIFGVNLVSNRADRAGCAGCAGF